MDQALIETLPLSQRLALSYAPRRAQAPTLTMLALDDRLAAILRQRGEPAIAQIKLAWWRDRLAGDPANWPQGEPLLARLRDWPGDPRQLGPLVDGWEMLLADRLAEPEREAFAHGKAQAWAALAEGLHCRGDHAAVLRTARRYALADLALHLDAGAERDGALAAARAEDWERLRLDPAMRPLQVLHALARRAVERGAGELLAGPGAGLLALRVGITGR